MLIVKSKYKIAKRLGAGVFEQTQSQKFSLSEARSKAAKKPRGRGGSDYGKQMLEKQRVRFTYGLSERQLSNYAEAAFEEKEPGLALHRALEMRADNVAYRARFAPTRRAARQMVSHGHLTVNGKRITTPSYHLRKGDILAVREGKSRKSPLFTVLGDVKEGGGRSTPAWVAADMDLLRAEIKGEPLYNAVDVGLDYSTVFEFYSR